MKTIAIGDVHGRSLWKLIVNQEQDADRIVFIGDYFDSFDIKGEEQLNNFLDIIEFKKTTNKETFNMPSNYWIYIIIILIIIISLLYFFVLKNNI